jgi:battenin
MSTCIKASIWLLGLLNNLSYVIVIASAKDVSQQLNALNLIGLLQWANVLCGLPVRLYNGLALEHISIRRRIVAVVALLVTTQVTLGVLVQISFPGTIVAILVMGAASSLGEAVVLTHLRSLDATLAGYWSSGTGMAGVVGSLGYLLFRKVAGSSNRTIFFAAAPLALIYWIAFTNTERKDGSEQDADVKLLIQKLRRSGRKRGIM